MYLAVTLLLLVNWYFICLATVQLLALTELLLTFTALTDILVPETVIVACVEGLELFMEYVMGQLGVLGQSGSYLQAGKDMLTLTLVPPWLTLISA